MRQLQNKVRAVLSVCAGLLSFYVLEILCGNIWTPLMEGLYRLQATMGKLGIVLFMAVQYFFLPLIYIGVLVVAAYAVTRLIGKSWNAILMCQILIWLFGLTILWKVIGLGISVALFYSYRPLFEQQIRELGSTPGEFFYKSGLDLITFFPQMLGTLIARVTMFSLDERFLKDKPDR